MADERITDLAVLTGASVASGDEFVIVDVSDTSMAASGTDKKIAASELAVAIGAALNVSGTNTGDQDLSSYATTAAVAAGYQPLDSDLTAIAALATTSFGRSILAMADAATVKTALSLVKGDVGLGNVDDTSDANKPVSTAQAAADALALAKASNLSDLANAGTARTNLGLGSAATHPATDFDAAGAASTEQTRALAAEALLAPIASPTFTGTTTAPEFSASGLTGAAAGARWVGATSSGAPASGTFAVGDYVIDRSGAMWICTVAGTPGTWVNPTTQLSGVALELLLNETVNYRPASNLKGNTSLLISQSELLGILPVVSSIAADGVHWTVTFGSSILGTLGAVGDTFPCWTSGFTPSGWNTGSFLAPLTATVTSSTTVTIPNATSPSAATVTGQLVAVPEQYFPYSLGPPAILEMQGTNTFKTSVNALYGIGPVWQNHMIYANSTPFSGTFTVTNGSNQVTIAGDQRASIVQNHKAIVNTGTPPAQDTSKLAANTIVNSVGYDGANTIVTLSTNWLGSTGTATIFFPADITTGEAMVNNSFTQARGGSVVSFPINSATFAKPGEGQGWSLGYWHGPVFQTTGGSSLVNVNDCGHVLTSFFDSGSSALQRLGVFVDDAYTARNTQAHLGSVAKQIGVALGTMTADAADYYPFTGAAAANGNVGFLNSSTTFFPHAPPVCYTSGTVTLSTSPATVNVDSTAGFPSTGTFLAPVTATAGAGAGHYTTVTYTGTTSTSFTGCTIASGSDALLSGVCLIGSNRYQDVTAGTFTVQAYGTTASLKSTSGSQSATTAASVISTGTPLYSGQVLRIINVSAAGINLTFTSGATPGLQLGAARRILGSGGFLELQWSSTLSLWCETAYSGGALGSGAVLGAFQDMGAAAGVNNAANLAAGTETTLLSAASGNVIPAAVSIGDYWDIEFSGNILNNTATGSINNVINIYFGSFAVDTATLNPGTANATLRSFRYKLRVTVETLGAGSTATVRVGGERYGIDNPTGVGTGWRTGASNTWSFRPAESVGPNASLALNAAQSFDIKTILNSSAGAISGTAANLKMTLTECVVKFVQKNQ